MTPTVLSNSEIVVLSLVQLGTVQENIPVSISISLQKSNILSASLYVSKRGAY